VEEDYPRCWVPFGLFRPPHTLGYLITTFGLLTLLFSIIERSRVWTKVFSALATVVVTYIAFSLWLGVQLPKGYSLLGRMALRVRHWMFFITCSMAFHWTNARQSPVLFSGGFNGTLWACFRIGTHGAIAILLPATFRMSPVTAIIMLTGIYYGAMYGGPPHRFWSIFRRSASL